MILDGNLVILRPELQGYLETLRVSFFSFYFRNTKIPNWWDEENFTPPVGPSEERKKKFWIDKGQNLLNKKVNQKLNTNKAKNLIIFIGDGMGLATLMATRSYIDDVKVGKRQ